MYLFKRPAGPELPESAIECQPSFSSRTTWSTIIMSDYDFRPGGSLKLKGVIEGGVSKK